MACFTVQRGVRHLGEKAGIGLTEPETDLDGSDICILVLLAVWRSKNR